MTVAVLFARADSNYKALPGVDVWDVHRDARRWPGGAPVIAHPPCRAWGRLRHFAKPRADEKDLALFAIEQVRAFGGVLEHPAYSTLFHTAGLPMPHKGADRFGGWTMHCEQFHWGHKAAKATWLYIVGCAERDVPEIPVRVGKPTHVIQSRKRNGHLPHVSKAEREHTPIDFCHWLVALAIKCGELL